MAADAISTSSGKVTLQVRVLGGAKCTLSVVFPPLTFYNPSQSPSEVYGVYTENKSDGTMFLYGPTANVLQMLSEGRVLLQPAARSTPIWPAVALRSPRQRALRLQRCSKP